MPKLERFSAPAELSDPRPDAWNERVQGLFAQYLEAQFPQFYDPTEKNTPPSATEPILEWTAFPALLNSTIPSRTERLRRADEVRSDQDEYCEWTVERRAGKIIRVTFTTELPEYWDHLFRAAPNRVVSLYQRLVDPRVKRADLQRADGGYKRMNRWNQSKSGRIAHLIQVNNNLGAAVDLVAKATILRVKNGQPVTNKQELVRCANLGNPLRNSDPQIASAVNVAARQGNEITLADPVGLYLGRPKTAGMVTPDGTDAAKFWKIERGNAEHTLRARFEVPSGRDYEVGDIAIAGQRVEFGGQIAERVPVQIKAVIKKANHQPQPKPCGA